MLQTIFFLFLLFAVAFLYSTVGHGGASGYLALMALFSFTPEVMRPSALVLNIFVSLLAFVQFYRSGHFKPQIFWPIALASIPMAFIGGITPLNVTLYKQILGIALVITAIRFSGLIPVNERSAVKPRLWISLVLGLSIGYFSGLIGIGGGIILSPILLLLGWTNMKQTAAISAAFILVNSLSGLTGLMTKAPVFSSSMMLWVMIAFAGGLAGSYIGANRFSPKVLSRILAGVLVIASIKLIFA